MIRSGTRYLHCINSLCSTSIINGQYIVPKGVNFSNLTFLSLNQFCQCKSYKRNNRLHYKHYVLSFDESRDPWVYICHCVFLDSTCRLLIGCKLCLWGEKSPRTSDCWVSHILHTPSLSSSLHSCTLLYTSLFHSMLPFPLWNLVTNKNKVCLLRQAVFFSSGLVWFLNLP